jgi:hypothetical protein
MLSAGEQGEQGDWEWRTRRTVIVNASFAAAPCVGEPWLWGFLLQDLDAETRRMPLVAPLRVNLGERFLELFLVKLEGRRLTVHIESVMPDAVALVSKAPRAAFLAGTVRAIMSLLKFEPKDAIERCGQRKDEQLVKRAMVCGKRLAAQRSRRLTPATAEVEPDSGDEWWKRCRDCEFHLSCWSSSTRVMQTCASDLSVVALPSASLNVSFTCSISPIQSMGSPRERLASCRSSNSTTKDSSSPRQFSV